MFIISADVCAPRNVLHAHTLTHTDSRGCMGCTMHAHTDEGRTRRESHAAHSPYRQGRFETLRPPPPPSAVDAGRNSEFKLGNGEILWCVQCKSGAAQPCPIRPFPFSLLSPMLSDSIPRPGRMSTLREPARGVARRCSGGAMVHQTDIYKGRASCPPRFRIASLSFQQEHGAARRGAAKRDLRPECWTSPMADGPHRRQKGPPKGGLKLGLIKSTRRRIEFQRAPTTGTGRWSARWLRKTPRFSSHEVHTHAQTHLRER